MLNKFKKKMFERTNKKVIEYALNNKDVWLEVLKQINIKYKGRIFADIIIEDNHFNNFTLTKATILGDVFIKNNTYIPEDDDLKDKKPFVELSNSELHKQIFFDD